MSNMEVGLSKRRGQDSLWGLQKLVQGGYRYELERG